MNRQQRRQVRRQEQGTDPEGEDAAGASGGPVLEVQVPDLAGDADLGDTGVQLRPEVASARPGTSGVPRRTGPRQFLHEVNVEMRKVAWPTRAETINYSTVVFVTLAILMALIFVLDLGFTHVAGFLFNP
jgi:preprotein translocase subunit SecE